MMNTIKTVIQPFKGLTTHDLYEILKVRAAVFVVEQNCPSTKQALWPSGNEAFC